MVVMEYRSRKDRLWVEIEPVITGLGYSLVDFTDKRSRNSLQVDIVIYNERGITLDDCTLVHKTVLPRIEMLEDREDVYLEVSSPGTSRTIKTVDEFAVFTGKTVKVLLTDESEWITGKIVSIEKDALTLKTKDDTFTIDNSDIRKAKLD